MNGPAVKLSNETMVVWVNNDVDRGQRLLKPEEMQAGTMRLNKVILRQDKRIVITQVPKKSEYRMDYK